MLRDDIGSITDDESTKYTLFIKLQSEVEIKKEEKHAL